MLPVMVNKARDYIENSSSNDVIEGDTDFESLLYSQASEILWTFCPPVIILFGTFGNIMTIVIIRRMSEGQSSNSMFLYFTALAVSDLVILYIGLLRKWLVHVFGFDFSVFHDVLCKLQIFLINSCGMISAWLVVSMTTHRVVSVVWSQHKSLSCAERKVGLVVGVIVLAFVALNFYRLYAFGVMRRFNATQAACETIDEDGIKYFDWYVFPWIDLVTTSLVPFSVLIVGNSVLVWKVIQSVQVARVMTAGGGDQVNSRQKKASSLTVTLITASFAFLLFTVPICVYIIFDPNFQADTARSLSKWRFTWAICNLSWYINSAINFYLYCLSGTRFRREVKRVFCTHCARMDNVSANILTRQTAERLQHYSDTEGNRGSDF